jgi:hypothetical protein
MAKKKKTTKKSSKKKKARSQRTSSASQIPNEQGNPQQDEQMENAIESLQRAYDSKQLTIYLGAGVSIASGLPSWEQLVLSMYFRALHADRLQGWRPYPNYLFAIAEWYLKENAEPLDVVARKTKLHFGDDHQEFMTVLHESLYAGFVDEFDNEMDSKTLRDSNPTLRAVAQLCEISGRRHGVRSVVSYNYDNLLEAAVEKTSMRSIWTKSQRNGTGMPVYHVHGFVPYSMKSPNSRSAPGNIIFTEDQYFTVAQNPYSWSNVVQIQCMSSSVGLMIGLSLSDRNIRRLLQAVNSTPLKRKLIRFPRAKILRKSKATRKSTKAVFPVELPKKFRIVVIKKSKASWLR